jgi:hypothetical protein
MDELTLDDKKYLSSKRAAQITGYAKDYVGQLAREGRVEARLVGRNWYILESSILEHRFGAEEEKAPVATPEELSTTWETPKYISESPTMIPELAPKPLPQVEKPVAVNFEPSDSRQVLEDMQSAWKEWFETQPKSLPDTSAMLLPDHEESHFEIKPIQPVPVETPTAHIEPEEEAEIVHIERHSEPEVATAPVAMDVMPVRRVAEPAVTMLTTPTKAEKTRKQKVKRGGSANILRAVFTSVAVVAVAVTLIGTGGLDSFATGSAVTDFFSGTVEVNK